MANGKMTRPLTQADLVFKARAIELKESGRSVKEVVSDLRAEGCKRGLVTVADWVKGVRDLRIDTRDERTRALKERIRELKALNTSVIETHRVILSEGLLTRLGTQPSYDIIAQHYRRIEI